MKNKIKFISVVLAVIVLLTFLIALVPGSPKAPLLVLASILIILILMMRPRNKKETWGQEDTVIVMTKEREFRYPLPLIIITALLSLSAILLPVPSFILDIALALLIGLSILTFIFTLIVLFVQIPAWTHKPAYPLLTILMLSFPVNIAISRLLFTEGIAGRIVEYFGNIVMTGNIVIAWSSLVVNILFILLMLVIALKLVKHSLQGYKFTRSLTLLRMLALHLLAIMIFVTLDVTLGFAIGVWMKSYPPMEIFNVISPVAVGQGLALCAIATWLSFALLCHIATLRQFTTPRDPSSALSNNGLLND